MVLKLNLNENQQKAVDCVDKSVFVTAGPGSGKTRVLTQRVINLIKNHGISPTEITCLTFTRNAASQMKERLTKTLGEAVTKKLWVTTIHGFCMRILGTWGHKVGLKEGFSVYDDRDQLDIIAKVQADLGIKTKPQTLLKEINRGKVGPARQTAAKEFYYRLKQNNATNFQGLLDKAIHILANNPEVVDYYHHRFHYVHLDEMNDTSDYDYSIVKLITQKHKNLMAVGDLDQCIYTFRGSNAENIDRLEFDHPGHETAILDMSYRCTKPVVEACNKLIKHNKTAAGKVLKTEKAGHPVMVHGYATEDEEARAITSTIRMGVENGLTHAHYAILCRLHSVGDAILSALQAAGVPVSVAGTTLRFLDLDEIRLFHCYLRFFVNPRDDFSFEKIIDVPNRNIRGSTKAKIRALSRQGDISVLEAALLHYREEPEEEQEWLKHLAEMIQMDFPDQVRAVYNLIHDWYAGQDLTTRANNLTKLLDFISEWQNTTPDEITGYNYLAYVSGINQQDDVTTDEDSVKLMTVHASKGLEFPIVIMPGCENLIFPMNNKADTPEKIESLEEERRLFYVGMSRSQYNLMLTFSGHRLVRGRDREMEPSIFLREAGLG